MTDFVLIHGSMQGGWIWRPVAERLHKAGHRVLHPSLDGCAERAPSLRPEITLASQAGEIARLIFFEDFNDVVVVGTSAGGIVTAAAAQEIPERISRIVLVDALLPIPGETIAEVNRRERYDERFLSYGLKPHEVAEKAFTHVEPPALRAWAQARYTLAPRIPVDGPIDLERFWARRWKADVLRCTLATNPSEAHQRRNAERLGASYRNIEAGHYPMLSHPDELVRYLLSLA